jgi:uncharacterized protein YutE (UPF0331/DUF86 family)
LVDPEGIEARLSRLSQLLDELEQIRSGGHAAYEADFRTRLALQHALQLSIQTCIDIGAHLLAERNIEMPGDYRGVFTALVPANLDRDLAERLGRAAGMRNILVHEYLDVDDQRVWGALESLDDLRAFAAYVQAVLG